MSVGCRCLVTEHGAMLRRFSFYTAPGLGIGVTAYTEDEATNLARGMAVQFKYKILDIVPDIDIQTLGQVHVTSNMHLPNLHGVWFPISGSLG